MRLELIKLLEKLGVSRVLSPYETQPWVVYDEVKGLTCSAEVRMGPDAEDLEAEIQLLKDEDAPHDETETSGDSEEDSEDGGGSSVLMPGGRQQVLWMRCEPILDQWTVKLLRIKDKDYVNEFHDWEGKGCEFFLSCVEAMQMGEIPDIDVLIEDKMKDTDSWGGGRRGRVGRKSPKIKPASLLGMKKP